MPLRKTVYRYLPIRGYQRHPTLSNAIKGKNGKGVTVKVLSDGKTIKKTRVDNWTVEGHAKFEKMYGMGIEMSNARALSMTMQESYDTTQHHQGVENEIRSVPHPVNQAAQPVDSEHSINADKNGSDEQKTGGARIVINTKGKKRARSLVSVTIVPEDTKVKPTSINVFVVDGISIRSADAPIAAAAALARNEFELSEYWLSTPRSGWTQLHKQRLRQKLSEMTEKLRRQGRLKGVIKRVQEYVHRMLYGFDTVDMYLCAYLLRGLNVMAHDKDTGDSPHTLTTATTM
eukprot:g1791.t1